MILCTYFFIIVIQNLQKCSECIILQNICVSVSVDSIILFAGALCSRTHRHVSASEEANGERGSWRRATTAAAPAVIPINCVGARTMLLVKPITLGAHNEHIGPAAHAAFCQIGAHAAL